MNSAKGYYKSIYLGKDYKRLRIHLNWFSKTIIKSVIAICRRQRSNLMA